MRKTTRRTVALLLGLTLVAAAAGTAFGAGKPGFETYVVRPGDTLSAIAGRIFGDVKRWREIHAANPQVTNANRIYPGDSLFVPVQQAAQPAGESGLEAREDARSASAGRGPAGDVVEPGAAPVAPEAGPAAAALVPELPLETVRAVAVVSPALYRSAGYLADGLPVLAIVASEDEKILLATDDAAIVNAPVSPGSRFTVVRADRRVYHPVTGKNLGWLIRILGTAEVTCRDEVTSTVRLLGMRDAASIGDYLVPIDPGDTLEENLLPGRSQPDCVAAGPADAIIVAFDDDRLVVGEQDIVYVDRGRSSGVVPGKRFTIYRPMSPAGRVAVGELQVLRAGEDTSTALITTSALEVHVGDLLRSR